MRFREMAFRAGWLEQTILSTIDSLDRLAKNPPLKRDIPAAIEAIADALRQSTASLETKVAEKIAADQLQQTQTDVAVFEQSQGGAT